MLEPSSFEAHLHFHVLKLLEDGKQKKLMSTMNNKNCVQHAAYAYLLEKMV